MRRPWTPLTAAVVLLMLGALVAWGVGGALGLSFSPADVPAERAVAEPLTPLVAAPRIDTISVQHDPRLALAAAAVADALVRRGQSRPTITQEPGTGPASGAGQLRVVVGGAPFDPPAYPAEAYRLRGDGTAIVVEAAGVSGAAAGLYAVADRIRSGTAVLPQPGAGDSAGVVAPRLGLRLTDVGSVGREPDPAAFAAGTDYSLNTDIVGKALLPAAPWVDRAAVDRIDGQFRQFVEHSLAQGYNGVVVPGFLEYVTFSLVGDGHTVYPEGDDHVARARALVAAFGPVFRHAADLGMRVYLLTDMLAVSPPLERYLQREFGGSTGGARLSDPRFWQVYQLGLTELFEAMPFVAGLMVRIGEGGDVYAQSGWDYSSKIAVTSVEAVRAMLRALLSVAGTADKDLIFRTWSVGVGAVGDLHTNPESYDEVLGGIDDPHLIVSTKYTLGDFYSHLPFNGTLTGGTQRRIVEFQARREFEGFGALPNDLTGLHQQALRRFLAANPHVEGIWTWTQDGGPLRAGPMTLYLRAGFWQLYDLNAYTLGRLAQDPDAPAAQLTADWVRQTFSNDPATVAAVCEMFAMSREAVTKGLYIGAYADRSVRALGLEPPPMMWIFEWDIVTGDSAALDSIYAVVRDQGVDADAAVDAAVAEGERAVELAGRMRAAVAATDPATWHDPVLRARLIDTLVYEADLFGTLGAYRTMVLRHVQWLDTGDRAAYDAWRQAESRYLATRAAHVTRYGGDVDLPAYNFTAADLGAARADRDLAMAWLARALLVALVAVMATGALRSGRRRLGLRALWVGATRPWRLADLSSTGSGSTGNGSTGSTGSTGSGSSGSTGSAPTRADRVVVIAVPAVALVASRLVHTWFAAPAHLVVTLGAWLLFAGTARLLIGRRDPFHLWAAIGGVALLRTVLLLAVLAVRGPGHYWLEFWTAPTARSGYVCVAFAAFGWLFVATGLVLRDRYGLRRRRVTGALLVAAGVPLALLGGLVAAIGLERALTIWNDQLALLPWGLSRILGITVYLGIPAVLPAAAGVAGLLLMALGGACSAPSPRRAWRRARRVPPPQPSRTSPPPAAG
ncbi:hypothetical protein ACFO1B_45410 [Dactylosporangium siamense]|uniref:Glycosyl hydrolase family 67 C-terminal domain-containing protein n=1 Tax=Dactylosporangium siamense TaxID=685454 RepID=A0A919UGK4_9ACTN|nr:hypothetical protein [Dactylosporangium siamense]GIG51401.1 hypothetical protein Dsi01nite_094420 [Dactylosporangium siamense]